MRKKYSSALLVCVMYPIGQADIFCKFKFVSLVFPEIANCSGMIDSLVNSSLVRVPEHPKDLKKKIKAIGGLTVDGLEIFRMM